MRKFIKICPRCGLYMSNYLEYIFGGARIIYNCPCGYSTKEDGSGVYCDNKTHTIDMKSISNYTEMR